MDENLLKVVPEQLQGIPWETYLVDYGVKAVGFLVLLFITWLVARWLSNLLVRSLESSRLDTGLVMFLGKMLRIAVLVLGIFTCLSVFGVETTGFAAALAATGFAVGMALQGTLSNFASGIMILMIRPFRIGDFITAGGASGTVSEIDIFNTAIDTPDNRRVTIPNSAIFGSQIENLTFHKTRRVDVLVGVEYSADVDETRRVLTEAAHSLEKVLKDPSPIVALTGLGASSVDWAVRAWVDKEDFWPVRDELTAAVKKSLDQAGIGIPFPQMDVHLDDEVLRPLTRQGVSQGAQESNH